MSIPQQVRRHALDPLLTKLELRSWLEDRDRAALAALPHRVQRIEAGAYLVREGDRPDRSCVLLSGFVVRHKLTETGERQIVSVNVAGDFVDLEGALLNVADHNAQAISPCEVAFIPRAAVRELILSHPRIAAAMWVDSLIDGAIYREWVVNIGRRDGRARIAHLLCELASRMKAAGLAGLDGYELPMTQEQIADATGLTSVHVNRVLKRMDAEGLIVRTRRHLAIPDWILLREAAGFHARYLHLDQKLGRPGAQLRVPARAPEYLAR